MFLYFYSLFYAYSCFLKQKETFDIASDKEIVLFKIVPGDSLKYFF